MGGAINSRDVLMSLFAAVLLTACGGGSEDLVSLPGNDDQPSSNDAPTITGSPLSAVSVGATYSFQALASDPDGDSLAFSILNIPGWASFDADTGILSGTPANSDVGTYLNISISVSDGQEVAALPAFSITVATGGVQTLTWTVASTKTDNSVLPLSEVSGYWLYIGTSANALYPFARIDDGSVTQYTLSGLPDGVYYAAVTSFDAEYNESDYSNIVTINI